MKVHIGRYPKDDKERKISIKIDRWDVWSADNTLSLIIHPLLVELQKNKHGAPSVDDEDVPEEFRSTSAPPTENDWTTDDNYFKRWDWVLDEMIWTFAQKLDDDVERQFHTGERDIYWQRVDLNGNALEETLYRLGDPKPKFKEKDEDFLWQIVRGPNDTHVFDREGWEKWRDRKQNGFRLFGKYFESLWD